MKAKWQEPTGQRQRLVTLIIREFMNLLVPPFPRFRTNYLPMECTYNVLAARS